MEIRNRVRRHAPGRTRLPLPAVVGILAMVAGDAHAGGPPPAGVRVTGLSAKLFYSGSGTFSDDVLRPDAVLFNVPIGQGAAKEPASALFVVVELSGPQGDAEVRRIVDFRADYKTSERDAANRPTPRRARVRQLASPGTFDKDGRSHAGFWLYGVDCSPVTLSVRIAGAAAGTKLERTIPFRCGE